MNNTNNTTHQKDVSLKTFWRVGFRRKIAHKGTHGEIGGVSDGGAITTLGAFHTFRKPCVAGV